MSMKSMTTLALGRELAPALASAPFHVDQEQTEDP